MIQTIIGKKVEQTQTFLENGVRIPVTEIAFSEHVVLQVKTPEKDSYTAVQIGTGTRNKPTKAQVGLSKKAGTKNAPLHIREARLVDESTVPTPGDIVDITTVLKPGDIVQVSGTSKGKGFAGAVKRHNFKGGPKTHGQSDRHRAPGSIGQGTTPGRVYKGKRMAGRMGTEKVTVRNLTIVDVDVENGKILISGLVPGHKNAWVYITKTGEDKKFVPLLTIKEEKKTEEDASVVTPEDTVKTPDETVTEPAATVEAPADSAPVPSGEVKEAAPDVEEEKQVADFEEKEAMGKKAEENVQAEKQEEAAKDSAAVENTAVSAEKVEEGKENA